MVVLAVSNIVQLVSHLISGFFLLTQSDWSLIFVKVVAGNIDAAFDVYCAFVVLLAVNRLVAVICPVRYHSMFGHSSLRLWYALAVAIWAVDLAFFASPVRTLIWDWETCSWLYLESRAMRIFNECISVGGYSTATAIYALIFVVLVTRRKQQGSKLTSSEKNVLLQATFVAVFEWAQTLAWFLPFLPKGKIATLVFNFVWISNCVVSPVAYFALQKRTAVNCVSSTGVTTTLDSTAAH
ncbi:Protein SRT-62 [Aphelenchoides avenae]|nr:Protein SRT-62 [Aphelenchus avenae]